MIYKIIDEIMNMNHIRAVVIADIHDLTLLN